MRCSNGARAIAEVSWKPNEHGGHSRYSRTCASCGVGIVKVGPLVTPGYQRRSDHHTHGGRQPHLHAYLHQRGRLSEQVRSARRAARTVRRWRRRFRCRGAAGAGRPCGCTPATQPARDAAVKPRRAAQAISPSAPRGPQAGPRRWACRIPCMDPSRSPPGRRRYCLG